jgi:hypothetical protein
VEEFSCIFPVGLHLAYIGFTRPAAGIINIFLKRSLPMTYLDVVYNYGALPGEAEMRAIDSMREVYGVRRVEFNAKQRTVRVEFDASRMKQDAVAKLLRSAGIDIREQVELA